MNKDLKGLLREAERRGWVFKRAKKHIKGLHPQGATVTISATPSDGRALKNIASDLKYGV